MRTPHIRQSGYGLLVALFAVLGGLTACGFHPLYGDKSVTAVSSKELAAVQIDLIKDREGQMLRNELLDRFQPAGPAPQALYGLSIGLASQKVGLAILPDETGTRANLIMSANYSVRDLTNGGVLFKGTSRSIVGYNILDSEFATTSSETDAYRRAVYDLSEQITTRVSLVLANHKAAPKTPAPTP
jgi:LPS-assembly lipoprotein